MSYTENTKRCIARINHLCAENNLTREISEQAVWFFTLFNELVFNETSQNTARNCLIGAMGDEIVFEWWRDSRSLAVYAGADGWNCLKSWGSNMDTEMSYKELTTTKEDLLELWAWLTTGAT